MWTAVTEILLYNMQFLNVLKKFFFTLGTVKVLATGFN
jgi:hypothetical protein